MKDEWIVDEHGTLTTTALGRLRNVIENVSAVIVEHRFYRAGRAPHRFVCDDYEELADYVRHKSAAGDSFYFWEFEACCRDDNGALRGKIPNEVGQVPKGGAY